MDLFDLYWQSDDLHSDLRMFKIRNGRDMDPFEFGRLCFDAGYLIGKGVQEAQDQKSVAVV